MQPSINLKLMQIIIELSINKLTFCQLPRLSHQVAVSRQFAEEKIINLMLMTRVQAVTTAAALAAATASPHSKKLFCCC